VGPKRATGKQIRVEAGTLRHEEMEKR
jgi:hypothetical protein